MTLRFLRLLALCVCFGVTLSSLGLSAPLSLMDVHNINAFLDCRAACAELSGDSSYDGQVAHARCVAECGVTDRRWEKDGVPGIGEDDLELALLEFQAAQDPSAKLVCYRDSARTVVVPGALCSGDVCAAMPSCTAAQCSASTEMTVRCTSDEPGGERCWFNEQARPPACPDAVCDAEPVRSPQACIDADEDGTPAWLEEHLGRTDVAADIPCSASAPCGFDQVCGRDALSGAGRCDDRPCAGDCTAFHLELVAEDDQQAIVHLHFDFAPAPVRILDLNVAYDATQLTLVDARPLPLLTLSGKQLTSSHASDGTLRLSVFGTAGSSPVPTGRVVELVFQRNGPGATTVGFVDDDELQALALAPKLGEAQEDLKDDRLWGEKVTLRRRDEAPASLRLAYSFDSLDSPLSYSTLTVGRRNWGPSGMPVRVTSRG